MPELPDAPGGPAPPALKINKDSKVYLTVIGSAAATGAFVGGPPGVLVGAVVGTVGCALHYWGERPKRKNGSNQES
jgi:hypothetical protein